MIKQWDAVQMANPTPAARKATEFSYDVPGGQTTVTYPEGNQEVQVYEAGLPVEITKAPGQTEEGTWTLTYDPVSGGPETVTDPNGNVSSVEWSTDGRMLSADNGVDPAVEWTYDPDTGLPLSVADPSGVTSTYTYDNDINLASVSTPLNGSTDREVFYRHDDPTHPGDVTSVIDPNGNEWVYDYDTYGNVVSVTDPVGDESQTTYDLAGRPVTVVAPKGVAGTPADYRSTVVYDLNGRAGGSFGPTAAAITDSFGRAPTATGLGSTDTGETWAATSGVWGTNGGAYAVSGTTPIATIDGPADGAVTATMPVAQDGMGVVFRLSDASHYWKFTADTATDTWTLAKVGGTAVSPVTTTTGTCCDPNALIGIYMQGSAIVVSVGGVPLAMVTDPDYTTNTRHGLIAPTGGTGRIGSFSTDAGGSRSYTGFDANGNAWFNIDGSNHSSWIGFDPNNQPITEHRADGSTITNTFDANGRLKSYSAPDPTGAPIDTVYGYDDQDRLVSEDPAGVVGATSYSYAYSPGGSPGGETMTATQPGGGTTTASFDAAGRVSALNYSDATADVSYGYDDNGRLTAMTRTGASASTWTYDDLGRMTGSTRAGRSVGYAYDLAGNNTAIVYPGSNTVTRGFDDASRLETVTDWNNDTTSFGYDPNSNLTTTSFPNGVVSTRTYDHENRPTNIAVTNTSGTLAAWAQTFDNNNFVSTVTATGVGTSQAYTYNQLNQLTGNGTQTFTYDTADNLTALDNTTHQAFNDSNQICWQTSTWTPTGDYTNPCGTTPGWSTTYTFDTRGNRLTTSFPYAETKTHTYDLANRLTTYTQGTTTSASYIYDGDGLRLAKTVNTTDTLYTWQDNTNLPQLLVDGTDNYLYGPQGEPIARIPTTGTTTYIHQDHLGSTRLLTNNTGTSSGTYTYTPYGTTQTHTGATVSLQYAGQYTDTETGYQYLRARYYEPTTGQFLTRDAAYGLTRLAYGYTYQNPINSVDKNGLWPWDDYCVIGVNCDEDATNVSPVCVVGVSCTDPNAKSFADSSSTGRTIQIVAAGVALGATALACIVSTLGGCTGALVEASPGFATFLFGAGGASAAECAIEDAADVSEVESVPFRSDTSHIFREALGHLAEDTAENRSVISGAISPANLASTITLPDGSTLARYFQTLSDGTQVWAEVRNGIITNGGVNAVPR